MRADGVGLDADPLTQTCSRLGSKPSVGLSHARTSSQAGKGSPPNAKCKPLAHVETIDWLSSNTFLLVRTSLSEIGVQGWQFCWLEMLGEQFAMAWVRAGVSRDKSAVAASLVGRRPLIYGKNVCG